MHKRAMEGEPKKIQRRSKGNPKEISYSESKMSALYSFSCCHLREGKRVIKSVKYRLFVSRYGNQSGNIATLAIWTAKIAASIHPFEQEANVVPAT
jgi:hypothetical protein